MDSSLSSVGAEQQRLAYRRAVLALGLGRVPEAHYLGVLTSDRPGEVLELALIDGQGREWQERFQATGPVNPGASRLHGLTEEGLRGEARTFAQAFADWWPLLGSGADQTPIRVVAWAGDFIQRAMQASLMADWPAGVDFPLPLEIIDVQRALFEADVQLWQPTRPPYPSLASVSALLGLPAQDHTAALSPAQLTRQLLQTLTCDQEEAA